MALGLEEAGYAVDSVENGLDAVAAAEVVDYDVLILDVGMPGLSGIDVCRRVRARSIPGPPILFLTARDAIQDRVEGLDAGAEDYLVKPFAFAELLARVRSLLRRGVSVAPTLTVGDLVLDPASRRIHRGERDIHLTAKEFALLEYLMRNVDIVVTKTMIADHVWNFELASESNFIEVLVYALRKKVDFGASDSFIQTIRGSGYRLTARAQ